MIDLLTDKCQIWIFDFHIYFTESFYTPNLNLDNVFIAQIFLGGDDKFTPSKSELGTIRLYYNDLPLNSDLFDYLVFEERSSISY